jgi:hypothetical protein
MGQHSLQNAIRDMAFEAFNDGDEIPGWPTLGYELLKITRTSMIVRVKDGQNPAEDFEISIRSLGDSG